MKDSKTWLVWLWLGVIITPVAIECSNNSQPISHQEKGAFIEPIIAKGTRRETPPTVTPSWEKPRVTSTKHLYHTSESSGIILKKGNKKIHTGMTSEEILNQLSLDYQDLYDYYGGAEEIF